MLGSRLSFLCEVSSEHFRLDTVYRRYIPELCTASSCNPA